MYALNPYVDFEDSDSFLSDKDSYDEPISLLIKSSAIHALLPETNSKVAKRLKDGKKAQAKLITIIKQYINQIEIQIQYLTLIKEDNINPFKEILKLATIKSQKAVMPLSCHFYIQDRSLKRYKTWINLAVEEDHAHLNTNNFNDFADIVKFSTLKSGNNIDKKYMQAMHFSHKSKNEVMLAQIEVIQLQIRQLIISRIHYCD